MDSGLPLANGLCSERARLSLAAMPRKASHKRDNILRAEVAVVGGGLSGLSLGIACAAAGIEIAVIDREDPAKMLAAPYDGRTTAIAYGSQQVLRGIGVWDALVPDAQPINEIRVADGNSPLFLHYDHRALGDNALGFIVENRKLRHSLIARAQNLPSLTLFAPLGVETADYTNAGTNLTLSDGRSLRASLVVGADGRNSPLRQAAGIKTVGADYRQTAIVCTVRHEAPHHGVAVEHFRAAGPFAILPMTGNRSSIVWTEHRRDAPALLKLDDADFTRELAARFGDYLGALEVEGGRWSYPLSVMHALRYTAPRLALVGDAAHVIHPIAGQGWNLGVRDVAALAELIVDAARLGLDLGNAESLRRYERWRRVDNVALTAITDGLNRLFSNDIAPVRLVRDVGLATVNRMPSLKRVLMRHAMGLIVNPPRLIRGEAL
jgi:2-octaprenyl-6-methoxyphenol hydroxylase